MLAAGGELAGGLVGVAVAVVAAAGGYLTARAPAKIKTDGDVAVAKISVGEKAAADLFGAYATYAEEARRLMQEERAEFQRQLATLRAVNAAERSEWLQERGRLESRIDELEAKVTALLRLRSEPPT